MPPNHGKHQVRSDIEAFFVLEMHPDIISAGFSPDKGSYAIERSIRRVEERESFQFYIDVGTLPCALEWPQPKTRPFRIYGVDQKGGFASERE